MSTTSANVIGYWCMIATGWIHRFILRGYTTDLQSDIYTVYIYIWCSHLYSQCIYRCKHQINPEQHQHNPKIRLLLQTYLLSFDDCISCKIRNQLQIFFVFKYSFPRLYGVSLSESQITTNNKNIILSFVLLCLSGMRLLPHEKQTSWPKSMLAPLSLCSPSAL